MNLTFLVKRAIYEPAVTYYSLLRIGVIKNREIFVLLEAYFFCLFRKMLRIFKVFV